MKRNPLLAAALVSALALALASCNTTPSAAGTTEPPEQVAGFSPTGDPEKDAQHIADLISDQSRRLIEGEASPDDQQLFDKMIQAASDHYSAENRLEEFQQALTEATEAAINDLATELGH